MNYGNFIEYDKQYSFLNKYAKKFKAKLMPNQLLVNRPVHFIIKSSSNLNASVFVGDVQSFGDIIYLTQADFNKLSKNDLKALLSHEIGHIDYGVASHLFVSMLEVISSFCLFGCFLISSCIFYSFLYLLMIACVMFLSYITSNITSTSIISQIHPALFYISLFVISLFILLSVFLGIHSLVGRRNEKFADRVGAYLVGKKNYLHMLKSFKNHEANELNSDKAMAQKLRFSPKAYFHCLVILFFQHIKYRLSFIHPSWKRRIRAIKKLKIGNQDVK